MGEDSYNEKADDIYQGYLIECGMKPKQLNAIKRSLNV